MKINIPQYLKRKPVFSTNEKTYFDDPKDGLSNIWDKLASIYSNIDSESIKTPEENMKIKLNQALLEANTTLTTFDLIDKNIIKTIPVIKGEKESYNFKREMIESCMKIMKKCKNLLQKGVEKEKNVFSTVQKIGDLFENDVYLFENGGDGSCKKNIGTDDESDFLTTDKIYLNDGKDGFENSIENRRKRFDFGLCLPINIINGRINISLDDDLHVGLGDDMIFENRNDLKPKGVIFSFSISNRVFKLKIEPNECSNPVKSIYEYLMEKKTIQSFNNKTIELKISPFVNFDDFPRSNATEYISTLCDTDDYMNVKLRSLAPIITNILKKGVRLEEVFYYINLSLSLIIIDSILRNHQNYRIIKYSENILEDGFPDMFFVVVGEDIIKIKRFVDGFEIFINEVPYCFR